VKKLVGKIHRRVHLTKEMLLPLPAETVRALSLENHLSLATVRAGRGGTDQIINLLRVAYLAFYLGDETASGFDFDLYRKAEAALNVCIERAERGEKWLLLDHEQIAVERVLIVHDEQLAAVANHRYLAAWDRLQRFITSKRCLPIETT
jgi:hypothetical protein